MKKFFIIVSILICSQIINAQHIPLRHIEVPDTFKTRLRFENYNNSDHTKDIYSVSFDLPSKSITHEKGIEWPHFEHDLWHISVILDSEQSNLLTTVAKMQEELGGLLFKGISEIYITVGESKYNVSSWYYFPDSKQLDLDITKSITEHISISGFQGIYCQYKDIVRFSDIEQELWRRSATEIFNKRKQL